MAGFSAQPRSWLLILLAVLVAVGICSWRIQALIIPHDLSHEVRSSGEDAPNEALENHEVNFLHSNPTRVSPDNIPQKRQVVISGPTGTVSSGSGSPGVNITTGGDEGNNSTGTNGEEGGGLTTDQKIQIGVGISGSLGALATIWGAWYTYRARQKKKGIDGAGGQDEDGTRPVAEGSPMQATFGTNGSEYGAKSELNARENRQLPVELPTSAR